MKPLVSICCITYNHEKYIAQAIDSFLMQKTSFPFEIIIHDDASTDNTPAIIRSYVSNYPNIIRPIYQTENKFSKGHKISIEYVWPKTHGKYIALCEGDDFWTNKTKLECQVVALQGNKNASLCSHYVLVMDNSNKITGRIPCTKSVNERSIIIGVSGNIHTSSIIFNKTKIVKYYNCLKLFPVGDVALKNIAITSGEIIFIPKVLSIYRKDAANSWTFNINKSIIRSIIHSFHLICAYTYILLSFNKHKIPTIIAIFLCLRQITIFPFKYIISKFRKW